MKTPKKKRTETAINFVNKHGHIIRLSEKMTLKELLKMGVTHVNIVQKDAPIADNEYRSTP